MQAIERIRSLPAIAFYALDTEVEGTHLYALHILGFNEAAAIKLRVAVSTAHGRGLLL
jgi:hypothetical protein